MVEHNAELLTVRQNQIPRLEHQASRVTTSARGRSDDDDAPTDRMRRDNDVRAIGYRVDCFEAEEIAGMRGR